MGIFKSFVGKGLPTTQMLNLVTGTLYQKFIEKDINNLDDFQKAILDTFNTINAALPGKHYDVPQQKEVEQNWACFEEWKVVEEPERKKVFSEFMKERMKLSKLDDSRLITGLVTPPAAMAAKEQARACHN